MLLSPRGGRRGQRPTEKQSREEEAEAGQEEGGRSLYADRLDRSARQARPRRRSEKGLVARIAVRDGKDIGNSASRAQSFAAEIQTASVWEPDFPSPAGKARRYR